MQNSLAKKKLSNFNNFMLKAIKKNTPTKLRVYEVRVANVLWTSVWNTSKTNLSFSTQSKSNQINQILFNVKRIVRWHCVARIFTIDWQRVCLIPSNSKCIRLCNHIKISLCQNPTIYHLLGTLFFLRVKANIQTAHILLNGMNVKFLKV